MNNSISSGEMKGNEARASRYQSTVSQANFRFVQFAKSSPPNEEQCKDAACSMKRSKDTSESPAVLDQSKRGTTWSNVLTNLAIPVSSVYHVRSKYSATVDKNDLGAILDRLQTNFQAESCQCDWEENRVKCHTLEETKFVVSFWLLKQNTEEVLVEVDRVAGESMCFCSHYAPLVLQTIRGDDSAKAEPKAPREPMKAMETFPEKMLMRVSTPKPPTATTSEVETALDLVANMLVSNLNDVSHLGLESLAVMVDSSKTCHDTAVAVARVVLTGSGSVGDAGDCRNREIHEQLCRLALTTHDKEMVSHRAFKALSVLAHAVNLSSEKDIAAFVLSAEQIPGVSSVVDRLLGPIHAAQQHPHAAYLATHILTALARAHHFEAIIGHINVMSTIQQAQFIGTCGHAALAHASRRLLTELAVST